MTFASRGSPTDDIDPAALSDLVAKSLDSLPPFKRALAVPPDITRVHSQAGLVTDCVYARLGPRLAGVLPAIGTHVPMTDREIATMYPGTPASLFLAHEWRKDLKEYGRIPSSFIGQVSEGMLSYDYPVQTNKVLASGSYDAIISIGQVVPHEVVGMANHAKNLFVGTGGKEAIDKSHFLGAAYGMERMMGRLDTPVRRIFEEALRVASPSLPPILWMLTVIGRREDGSLAIRGFFSGDDSECLARASELSKQVNIQTLPESIDTAVVWLDPAEFRTTWLGNKAVYRTRMAMADGGNLIILAPGLQHFGEDSGIDALIRKYGYRTSAEIRTLAAREADLAQNLSAAAHLIHGSSEGRFTVTYAPGPGVSRKEIESVGYRWAPLDEMLRLYAPDGRPQGYQKDGAGNPFFFVPNPALGLWTTKKRFEGRD